MASRFPSEDKVQLKARKGHDMKWSCDKHAEPIAFHCKKHKIPICHRCATKDHQKPCVLEDIEDVILEMRRKIEDTQTKIAATKRHLKRHEISASNHLQSVNDEVKASYNRKFMKLKSVKDEERVEIRLINEKADEEIRIINEKRERQIKECKERAEKIQLVITESEAKLISDIKTIHEKVKKEINELRSKIQHKIDIDNIASKIECIKQDDETLVSETPRVIALLEESLKSTFYQEVAVYLDRIERKVKTVRFVEGEVGGEYYGRIDGYIGKWELVKSIDISSNVNEPRVRGLIGDEIFLDSKDNALYVTNISSEYTEKVTAGDSNMYVTSCAPVDCNVMVCGKWREDRMGDSLDGCITLYDRQWKVIRDITIPRNTSSVYNRSTVYMVYVDVDRDGMILAAQHGQSNIYVINPANGKIVNIITIVGKKVGGEIQALSSGDVVVKTGMNVFTVTSRSGEEKSVIQGAVGDWQAHCCVDKLTDTLYITQEIIERKIYAVYHVSLGGNIQPRKIVEYEQSYHSYYDNPCLVTPSHKLVACDGDKLFVYKKSFIA